MITLCVDDVNNFTCLYSVKCKHEDSAARVCYTILGLISTSLCKSGIMRTASQCLGTTSKY